MQVTLICLFFIHSTSLNKSKMQNQKRVLIENVLPQLDNDVFFIKRIVVQKVTITTDVISDGHYVMEIAAFLF